jgi:peptide deformylase
MEILTLPNPILTRKAEKIKNIDEDILSLVGQMRDLLEDVEGVGLAAPQIGSSLQIIVIGFQPTEEQLKKNPDLASVPDMVIINPQIKWVSKEKSIEKEGCLSVPNTFIPVARHNKIHMEYTDEKGKKFKIKARGYLARVLQHETDHLAGKLIDSYGK